MILVILTGVLGLWLAGNRVAAGWALVPARTCHGCRGALASCQYGSP